jgi:hypothetical protein
VILHVAVDRLDVNEASPREHARLVILELEAA